jgi:hypothetical protein
LVLHNACPVVALADIGLKSHEDTEDRRAFVEGQSAGMQIKLNVLRQSVQTYDVNADGRTIREVRDTVLEQTANAANDASLARTSGADSEEDASGSGYYYYYAGLSSMMYGGSSSSASWSYYGYAASSASALRALASYGHGYSGASSSGSSYALATTGATSYSFNSGADNFASRRSKEGYSFSYTESVAIDDLVTKLAWADSSASLGNVPSALQGIFWMDQLGYSKGRAELFGDGTFDFMWDDKSSAPSAPGEFGFHSQTSKEWYGNSSVTLDKVSPSGCICAFGDESYSDGVVAQWNSSTSCFGPIRCGSDRHWGFSDNTWGDTFAEKFMAEGADADMYVCQLDMMESPGGEDFIFTPSTSSLLRDPFHRELMWKKPWGFHRQTSAYMSDGTYFEGNYPLIQIIDRFGNPTVYFEMFRECAMTVTWPDSDLLYYNAMGQGVLLSNVS